MSNTLTHDEAEVRLWAFAQMASVWIEGGGGGSPGEWEAMKASEADLLKRLTGSGRWQPFDTAPAADLPILVFREDAGIFLARFCECYEGAGLCWFTEEGEDLTGDLPSHWMPLPTRPPLDECGNGGVELGSECEECGADQFQAHSPDCSVT